MGTHITRALVVSIGLLFAGFSAPSTLLADSVRDFECEGNAIHVYIANANISEIDGNIVSKEDEDYCELPNGRRQGLTKISFIDYSGLTSSTYTLGQYNNDMPVDRWLIVNITGNVIAECFYANGNLNQNNSDPSCPGYVRSLSATDVLQGIVDSYSGTPLADIVEDKLQTALAELDKTPPDNQSAVGNIEGAVGDLEAAVNDGLFKPVKKGKDLMDQLASIARQLATAALAEVQQGGDAVVVAEAQQFLAEGDGLRNAEAFKDAVNKYKDALAKAESLLTA